MHRRIWSANWVLDALEVVRYRSFVSDVIGKGCVMTKYSNLQIWLHWIIFVLVAFQFLFHEPIAQAFDLRLEGKVHSKRLDPIAFGLWRCRLSLGCVRLWVRVTEGVPPYPKQDAVVLKLISTVVHWSFYALLLLLPITGGAAWFQGSEGAGNAHEALRGVLLILILLHVVASLVHYFLLKSNLFKRMWWG